MLLQRNFARVSPCVPSIDVDCSIITNSKAALDMEFLEYLAEFGKSYTTLEEFETRLRNWLETN